MRKPLRTAQLLSLIALIAGLTVIGAQGASAATSSPVTGNITVLSNVVDSTKQAGPNVIANATAQVEFSGDLAGTATEVYQAVTHPSGKVNLHGTGFFEGTVNGQSGSLTYVFRGDAGGGNIVIVHASGELAGMHGQIPYEALGGPLYSYSGVVRQTG
jgi:uncharacterized protein DUF3224